MATPEGKIQNAILKYLKSQGHFCFRVNNGAIHDAKLNDGYGGYRSNPSLMKGVPDIILIADDGVFVGIEVKAPKGIQSADQMLFERRCKLKNGRYHVVRSVEEVKELGF